MPPAPLTCETLQPTHLAPPLPPPPMPPWQVVIEDFASTISPEDYVFTYSLEGASGQQQERCKAAVQVRCRAVLCPSIVCPGSRLKYSLPSAAVQGAMPAVRTAGGPL